MIYHIGKYSRKFRKFYWKLTGKYPWGLYNFINECDQLNLENSIQYDPETFKPTIIKKSDLTYEQLEKDMEKFIKI